MNKLKKENEMFNTTPTDGLGRTVSGGELNELIEELLPLEHLKIIVR